MPEGKSSQVRILFPDDLKEYIARHREGTYLLLDVRQPQEYEESHLPGSKLIPLPELPEMMDTLDRGKETIVYCAVGGRSLMAARFLSDRGFENIMQLQGGLDAWEEATASGPVAFHLRFIRGDETAAEAALLAYRFEDGLERFHMRAAERTGSPKVRALLNRLGKAEESHKRKLLDLLEQPENAPAEDLRRNPPQEMMEGGYSIDEFMRQNEHFLDSVLGCLELAVMIETQALDLYLRMAKTTTDPDARGIFLLIGDEEKAHLSWLGTLLGQEYGAAKQT